MDRGAWKATVHGGYKESDMTERLSLSSDIKKCQIITALLVGFSQMNTHTPHMSVASTPVVIALQRPHPNDTRPDQIPPLG